MPYSVVVTVSNLKYAGREATFATIVETDVEVASEYSVTGLPTHGEIVAFSATTIAGRTIQPAYGRATGFDPTDANDIDNVTQQDVAARSFVSDQSAVRFYNLTDGTLFGQSTPDVNVVGTTTTEILIIHGMQV